jgi:gamma-glutamyltranspeptidase/glutathione hydrolase
MVSICTDLGVMAAGASGFITIWSPQDPPIVIDAYAEMPGRGLKLDERLDRKAREVSFDYGGWMHTRIDYSSIATPGIWAGLEMASQQYGTLPWASLVAPALHWAERGFPLSGGAAEYLSFTHQAIFSWHPESYRALHHADGSPLRAGEIVRVPGLVDSLRLIAEQGAAAFYTGTIGQRIAAEVQANGGLLTAADLAAYRAIPRSPIRIRFGDWEVVTNPAPAVGGACLAAMLLLLDKRVLREWSSVAVEQMVEIQQTVLDYRYRYFHDASEEILAAEVSRLLELASAGEYRGGQKSPATIHVSAVDSDGLACAISASGGYGSGVAIAGTGMWLNNSLGEIELHPQEGRSLAPGTRLASNMAPTVARCDDGTVLAIGSPGASRITTAIAQVLVNFVCLKMSLAEAVAHPRLHVEVFEGTPAIAYEIGLSVKPMAGWLARPFPKLSMYFGGVQAALWHPLSGLSAAADPRRAGCIAEGGRGNV